jgi:hypothetical protein
MVFSSCSIELSEMGAILEVLVRYGEVALCLLRLEVRVLREWQATMG